jgi:TonB dependent receptor
MRDLGDRPANPERTAVAKGYTVFSWTTRYRYRDVEAFFSVENLTNTDWRESQFFFTSRLPGEPAAGVAEVHFTPGNPRSFLGGVSLRF